MQIGVQNFATRAPPRFESKEAERAHSLQRLAAACRIFGRRGFSDGLLGHVTLRDPELPDHFWVNPVGIAMHQVKVSQLVQVDPQGQVVRGSGMVNPVGLLLHTAVHRARPEVNAVCHAHALHASTWSSFERLLDPITQDACIFFENQALILAPRVVRDAEAARPLRRGIRPAPHGHPWRPRHLHDRPDHRRGRLVVRADEPMLRSAAAGRGGGQRRPSGRPRMPAGWRRCSGRRPSAGCRSRRSGTRSS